MLRGWIAAISLLLASTAVSADNIDTGFAQDASTTYCQGIKAGGSSLKFTELHAYDAPRCPIRLAVTTTPTAVHVNEPITVTWEAKVITDTIAGNIFPKAYSATTKKAQAILTSFIKACEKGTNCANPIDGVPSGSDADGRGDFVDLKKTLRSYTFKFPKAGEYVLLALIELPGDADLNVSASDYIAFQKVTIVEAGVVITTAPNATTPNSTTPVPTNATTAVPTTLIAPGNTSLNETTNVVSNTPSTISDSTKNSTAAVGTEQSFFKQHTALLATAAGLCAVVIIVGYVTLMGRRTARNTQYHKDVLRVYDHNNTKPGSTDGESDIEYARKRSARNNSHHKSEHLHMEEHGQDHVHSGMAILSPPSSYEEVDAYGSLQRGSEFDSSSDGGNKHTQSGLGSITESNQHSISSQAMLYNPSELMSSAGPSRSTTDSEKVLSDDLEKDYFEPPSWRESDADSERQPKISCVSFESDLSVDDDNIKISSFASHDLSMFESERSLNVTSFASVPEGDRRFTAASYDSEEVSTRSPRTYSEASVDSYAFRPSDMTNSTSMRYSGFSMMSDDLKSSQGPSRRT